MNEGRAPNQLVDSLAGAWDPDKYTDDYRANLLRVIKAKLKGKKVKLEEAAEPVAGNVIDLMERLRQSLGQRGRPPRTRLQAADRPRKGAGGPTRRRARARTRRSAA